MIKMHNNYIKIDTLNTTLLLLAYSGRVYKLHYGKKINDADDYLFLYEQYSDWTARHECETKSQEEIFKQICF